jgi:hypothetical protein
MELAVNRTGVPAMAGAQLMPWVRSGEKLLPVTRGIGVVTAPELQR